MSEWGQVIDAYVRGSNGVDVRSNIERIHTLLDSFPCLGCWRDAIAELELQEGNLDAAIANYELNVNSVGIGKMGGEEGTIAVNLFRLGDLYEQRGDLDEAIGAYTRMAKRWENADAVLQPQVAEAKRRIDTLLDRKAQEN